MSEEIITENFNDLGRKDLQSQEGPRVLNETHAERPTPRHIIKCQGEKKEYLKGNKKNTQLVTSKENPV